MLSSIMLCLVVAPPGSFEGREVFDRLMSAARAERVFERPIGERVAFFALQLVDTPYVGFTLERDPAREAVFVTLNGLDCVTFAETALAFAHLGPHGTPADLVARVTVTRYRGGRVDGYLSRLHYTTDWFADNVARRTWVDWTLRLRRAMNFTAPIHFMSSNPSRYRQLVADPTLIPPLREIEGRLTRMARWFVPEADAAESEEALRSGDIVGLTDTRPGMDFAHVGVIVVIDGRRRFVHACSDAGRVVVDVTLSEYLARRPGSTGFSVVRPLPPPAPADR
jgi:hypothetical protein